MCVIAKDFLMWLLKMLNRIGDSKPSCGVSNVGGVKKMFCLLNFNWMSDKFLMMHLLLLDLCLWSHRYWISMWRLQICYLKISWDVWSSSTSHGSVVYILSTFCFQSSIWVRLSSVSIFSVIKRECSRTICYDLCQNRVGIVMRL